MRIRFQLALPLLVGVVVGVGFVLAAAGVSDAVHDALITVPGLARERAAEAAVVVVVLTGALVTTVAVAVSAALARTVVRPLRRMQQAAERLSQPAIGPEVDVPVTEVRDVARAIGRAAAELRARHDRELRERSELAALVEAVSEGILQLDAEGRIVRANPASRVLLGLPDDAIGRPAGAVLRHAELRRIVERAARGEATEAAELVLDDQRILTTVSPQPRGGAVATFVDLTDLRRLEEVRRDFVANASHELKTPLTSIRGYTETLLGGDLPEAEHRQFLATIARNATRLQRIVDDLLDLSRLEAGRWQPQLETLHVLQSAESCWLAFADRAGEQGVGFSVDGDGDDRATADRGALEQVFANLFDNALRHTPHGGRIRVTTRTDPGGPDDDAEPSRGQPAARARVDTDTADDPADGWLQVDVSDTGTGIPRDALPRIFERFYRADPARSRAEGGTGLGLSIVKHMVESMGGVIRARSELGKGTTLRLWLPRPR